MTEVEHLFFFFFADWGLNLGPHTCEAGTLPLEHSTSHLFLFLLTISVSSSEK
jgi:hypothetical protein